MTTQPKRTEPSRSLLQGKVYVPADKTDIRATFERARRHQCESSSSSGASIGSTKPLDMLQVLRVGLSTAAHFVAYRFEEKQ